MLLLFQVELLPLEVLACPESELLGAIGVCAGEQIANAAVDARPPGGCLLQVGVTLFGRARRFRARQDRLLRLVESLDDAVGALRDRHRRIVAAGAGAGTRMKAGHRLDGRVIGVDVLLDGRDAGTLFSRSPDNDASGLDPGEKFGHGVWRQSLGQAVLREPYLPSTGYGVESGVLVMLQTSSGAGSLLRSLGIFRGFLDRVEKLRPCPLPLFMPDERRFDIVQLVTSRQLPGLEVERQR